MKVGDKVKVTAKEHSHGLNIGDVVNILFVDNDGTIRTDDPDMDVTWWLWRNEFELLNQEQ